MRENSIRYNNVRLQVTVHPRTSKRIQKNFERKTSFVLSFLKVSSTSRAVTNAQAYVELSHLNEKVRAGIGFYCVKDTQFKITKTEQLHFFWISQKTSKQNYYPTLHRTDLFITHQPFNTHISLRLKL